MKIKKWTLTKKGLIIKDQDHGDSDYICAMPFGSEEEAKEMPQAAANARLIAAAPELLAAVKKALLDVASPTHRITAKTGSMLLAAIAKAEGTEVQK